MSSLLSNKQRVVELSKALYNFDATEVQQQLSDLFADDALVQLCYPFETLANAQALYDEAIASLQRAFPDLERRDTIIMSGTTERGDDWVGCCGYYCGTFANAWLDIPPTGHMAAMRFHEFYKFVDGKVVEYQAIWDIPELMMQANAWPMVPSLGREWHVPGPATLDGISLKTQDSAVTAKSLQVVVDMCDALGNHATGGVEAMRLTDYWHPRCSWYGPSGIGTARTLTGFRNWHQIPFLNGLPDRVGDPHLGHAFADDSYVGYTAWPGMFMTVNGSGWLGIAPGNQKISMRSLDFWRVEGDLIRENWVLIDLLSVYDQLGVDVLARMREFNKARV
ncbi:ester cyclase [Psychrobium sp. MM17-31]|uniref:ester cyclase n=1 Tax=Psychrobium sp. MM17-31 TaxID=2917758 RepID=UPI001EF726E1|nr:ester cyclase [Psychrobium sp. MM17-31]MCG7533189.1 ester cyclase [Psychrobium sp. MM17-31]